MSLETDKGRELQDKEWNKLSEDEQVEFICEYRVSCLYNKEKAKELEQEFGIHNLRPIMKPEHLKTYNDLMKYGLVGTYGIVRCFGTGLGPNKICYDGYFANIESVISAEALMKLARVMDLGYYGYTQKYSDKRYSVEFNLETNELEVVKNSPHKSFFTFCSDYWAKEFIQNNKDLLLQFFLGKN